MDKLAGSEQEEVEERIAIVSGEPLSDEEIAAMYARLPEVEGFDDDKVEFRLRSSSLPAPRPGETIQASFPPVDGSGRAPLGQVEGPNEVLRFQPEGEVPRPRRVSVTFAHPMVAVTSHDDSIAGGLPVTLTPQPPGKWRWLGTKTLIFESDEDFPMATDYTIAVSSTAESAVGTRLTEAFEAKFATNPVQLTDVYPSGGPIKLDPVILLSFDQRVDSRAMASAVELRVGGRAVAHRMASQAEIEGEAHVLSRVDNATEGTWLALKPVEALPVAATVEVVVRAGAPSAEGPRKTEAEQLRSFQTHGAMDLVEARCGWGECPPGAPFHFRFTNPIADDVELNALVEVSPAIANMVLSYGHNTITIQGRTEPRTKYDVRISTALKDGFGQNLRREARKSFTVGDYPASLTANGQGMVVLDPFGPRAFSVYSVNYRKLNVKIHRVQPSDWPAFLEYQQRVGYHRAEDRREPPGTLVAKTTMNVRGGNGELVETALDLTRALGQDGLGHAVIEIEADDPVGRGFFRRGRDEWKPRVARWVQSTQIGVDAFRTPEEMVVWATTLQDGKPLADVEIDVVGIAGARASTGADGLVTLSWQGDAAPFLFARKGNDTALLPESLYRYHNATGWASTRRQDWVGWYVADDRQMYKPGEEVRIKGWARLLEAAPRGGIAAAPGRSVSYRVMDPRHNEIGSGKAAINDFGGFDLRFELPDNANLGHAQVIFELEGSTASSRRYHHGFQIQEFRRPEYEVKAEAEPGPHVVGDRGAAWVQASYYSGGALPEADVTWSITRSTGSYSPPNWPGFVFGDYRPWWWHRHDGDETSHESIVGQTDFSGEHRIELAFTERSKPRPQSISAAATVMDVNRQAWSSTATMLVHPSRHYVGIRAQRWFYDKGKPIELDLIATDIDGKAVAGRTITVMAERLQWVQKGGVWQEEGIDPQECTVRSTDAPMPCAFKTPEGGRYRIVAHIEDLEGRRNESELSIWVSGGKQPPKRNIEEEEITLVPDKEEYAVGDVAEVLVQVPFAPAEAYVTLRRHGFYSQERITIENGSYTVRVPIEEAMLPNVHLHIDAVGSSPRTNDAGVADPSLPARPAFAAGSLNLRIATTSQRLGVAVEARQPLVPPGSQVQFDVDVKDADGKPVEGAEVLVFAVDEAVLALSNYQLGDPMSVFYVQRSPDVREVKSRPYVLLNDPRSVVPEAQDMPMEMEESAAGGSAMPMRSRSAAAPAPMMKMEAAADMAAPGGGMASTAIAVRENFDALAFFEPARRTDGSGRTTVDIKIPDSLTRYRIMAVAVKDTTLYGSGESTLTARLPLMVRPSPPRFLNFGDEMELPVIVQNQTNRDMEVHVVARGQNLLWTGPTGVGVTVPAQNRVEVRFPAKTDEAGRARIQVGAASADWADAAQLEFPVWTPATTEAFATYGVVDQGTMFQPVKLPGEIYHQFGGLEVTTSSTQLQALTDAFIYLVSYPYGCAEQIASRVLSVAALRDVLTAFEADGLPPQADIEAMVQRDLARIGELQNGDGGFGFWRRGEASWPYTTVHVAHALARAKDKGYDVPEVNLQRALNYLRTIEGRIPGHYSRMSRNTIRASALYVRMIAGDRDVTQARRLFGQEGTEHLSMEALGWVMAVLAGDPNASEELATIRRFFMNKVDETAATAEFASSYGEHGYLILHSARRTDAVILDALIRDQPGSDLIPKLVEGLLGHRTRGRWGNTQENVFILLALDHYFNVYEKVTPDFIARIWLGNGFVGEHAFRGRTTERHHVEVPFGYLADAHDGQATLAIDKDGAGRMYYRVGMRYAPRSLELEAADHGFAVERIYEAVDDPGDVRQEEDGVWHIRAGARVKVTVTMATAARRYHVALVDPLPAGLEALNPALATTANIPQDPAQMSRGSHWWWWGPWYQHQNMRDERAEAFATLLWGGVHSYTYYARATTPGTFVVPPAKAEEMYHPETFGRSASAKVIVR